MRLEARFIISMYLIRALEQRMNGKALEAYLGGNNEQLPPRSIFFFLCLIHSPNGERTLTTIYKEANVTAS